MARVLELDDAVAAATRVFAVGDQLDMDQVAATLHVSRATLYRVVGSRDRLLGEILWSQGQRQLALIRQRHPGTGIERALDVASEFNAGLVAYRPLRTFLAREPEAAFRVLFMPEAGVHGRFVVLWREVLGEAGLTPRLDLDTLAFVFVRLGESMLYADLLAGREPDLAMCRRVQHAVLTAETASQQDVPLR